MKPTIAALCLTALLSGLGLAQGPRKLSRSEAISAIVSKTTPEYPPIARQLRLEGIVEVEAVVGENGQVESVNIISGNPVLTKPAADAVKKWRFSPQTLDGKTVRAIAPVSLTFKL